MKQPPPYLPPFSQLHGPGLAAIFVKLATIAEKCSPSPVLPEAKSIPLLTASPVSSMNFG